MDKVAKSITRKLLENSFIQKNDVDICQYGLEIFLTLILEVSAILLASVFVGNLYETIIFLVGFLPVRMYAGGYHANTRIRCFGVLIFVYILFSTIILLALNKYFMVFGSIVIVMCIYKWAPLSLKNKSLMKEEKKRYKHISTIIASAECLLIISACVLGIYSSVIEPLFLGLLTVISSLIAGKIKAFIGRRTEI